MYKQDGAISANIVVRQILKDTINLRNAFFKSEIVHSFQNPTFEL